MESVESVFDFALELAKEAGARLDAGHGTIERGGVSYKGWRNLVTEIDLEVEEMVASRIEGRFPDHSILAEEGSRKEGTGHYRWIIDPLDGTTNYVHRHPMYAVSIGIEDARGLCAGIIYAPQLEELFTAKRGQGAHLGERPMRVSEEVDLSKALLASGFAYGKGTPEDVNLRNWSTMSALSRGLRRCGSAALDLAYVADGRYDGFWEFSLNAWDVAAGALLVTEAGGTITDCQGGDAHWRDGAAIAATNGRIHQALIERLEIPSTLA